MGEIDGVLSRVHRDEWPRVVAALARRFGDLGVAEEMTAEAFLRAVERWPEDGVPPNPGAWLTTTAYRRAIDRLRRESKRDAKHAEALLLHRPCRPGPDIEDDRLRLVLICCHPALSMQARVALTLRMVAGLTVPQIAQAFLVTDVAMSRRITRAKATIKTANIAWHAPVAEDLPPRLNGVLTVIYLIFNEGYLTPRRYRDAASPELSDEALRLARLVHAMAPRHDETAGLLALLLLTQARRAARISHDDELVPLDVQDRTVWDQTMIDQGHALVRACLDSGRPVGRFQILAAINAVHTDAARFEDTDWSQVLALYDQLTQVDPSPIVRLNRAVAVAEMHGPTRALAEVDQLPLAGYYAYHATRADLLRRQGLCDQARDAYDRAIRLATDPATGAFLRRRRANLRRDETGRLG